MMGEDLKYARTSKGLSRRALADLCSLHPDTVRYWEAKQTVNVRGYAPRLIFVALGIEAPKPQKRITARTQKAILGYFRTPTRAWDGVLRQCGAKTRKGKPCRAKPLPGKTRCKFHGGLSTGPRTPEGKARVADVQRRRWNKLRRDKEYPETELPFD